MPWMAYFQEDGALRYSVTPRPVLEHRARFECEKFLDRMTNPEVGFWWVWIEEQKMPDVHSQSEEHGSREAGQPQQRFEIAISPCLTGGNDGGRSGRNGVKFVRSPAKPPKK